MRNRVYITSIESEKTENELIDESNGKYKNIILFAPKLHAFFFNGKRYGSMNDIHNDSSVKSVWRLGICTDDRDLYSIRLIQESLHKGFNVATVIINGAWVVPVQYEGVSYPYPTFNVYMNVGQRAQVFLSQGSEYTWSYYNMYDDNVSVDNNNIIHAVTATTRPVSLSLYSVRRQENGPSELKELMRLNITVYGNGCNIYEIDKINTAVSGAHGGLAGLGHPDIDMGFIHNIVDIERTNDKDGISIEERTAKDAEMNIQN